MAIDQGVMSWKDVQFSPRDTWPVTLVTWPPGADTRAGISAFGYVNYDPKFLTMTFLQVTGNPSTWWRPQPM